MTQRTFEKILTNKYGAALTAIFCSVLWGSAFPVLKVTYEEMLFSPEDYGARMILASIRFFLAGLLLLSAVGVGAGQTVKIKKRFWPSVALLGILQISMQYFFFYNGLARTTGMKGAILQSSGIFFIVLLAHFYYKNDKLSWSKAFGLTTGFAGIVLINWGENFSLDFTFTGEGFLILAGLTSAVAMLIAKSLTQDISAFVLTAWQMIIGSGLLFTAGVFYQGTISLHFTNLAFGLLIYSVFLSATAFSLWYAVLKYNKAGEIAVYRFAIPIAGAILSAVFISEESINILVVGALILVTAGIMTVNSSVESE
ncbi:MAG: multidrug transporter [Gracilibacter sp. BRH_c7a]|nr:MAG: multidrug transporter [Gracilibacter sp. BRH_c7a]